MPRWILSLLVFLAMILCAEGFARAFLKDHWSTERLRQAMGRSSIKSLIEFDADPEIAYRLRSSLDTQFMESRVVTDEAGLRVDPSAFKDPGSPIRIAMLGDSTPFGWRVEYAQSYGERLRRTLEAKFGVPVVLRNYSVPGYNAKQELRQFQTSVRSFHPDLVLLHHDHNDWQPTGFGYGSWMPPEYGDNVLRSALWKLVLRRLKRHRGWDDLAASGAGGVFVGQHCCGGRPYEEMMESRKALVDLARADGIRVLVVVFNADAVADPHYETSDVYQKLHKQASDRFGHMGYLVLDLYPCYERMLLDRGDKDLRRFWMESEDHHPNAEGHQFIADRILEFVEATPELSKVFRKRE
jgi:lysophospholipase L1-like esterase